MLFIYPRIHFPLFSRGPHNRCNYGILLKRSLGPKVYMCPLRRIIRGKVSVQSIKSKLECHERSKTPVLFDFALAFVGIMISKVSMPEKFWPFIIWKVLAMIRSASCSKVTNS